MKIKTTIQLLLVVLVCSFLFYGPLRAQFSGGAGGVTQQQMNDAVATAIALIPTPLVTIPNGPNGTGSIGAAGVYVPGSAMQRQAVQRTVTSTDASGNFSVSWNTSFISSTPTVVVEAGNPGGTLPISCNWFTRTSNNVSGKCWQTATSLVALLGITITIAPSTPSTNTPISVIMAEPTQ